MRSDIHTYHVEKNEFLDLVVLGRQHVAYNGDEETREVFAVQHGADGVLHAFLPDAHLVRFLQVGGREDVGKRKEGGGGRGGEGHVAERDDERSERGLFPFFSVPRAWVGMVTRPVARTSIFFKSDMEGGRSSCTSMVHLVSVMVVVMVYGVIKITGVKNQGRMEPSRGRGRASRGVGKASSLSPPARGKGGREEQTWG